MPMWDYSCERCKHIETDLLVANTIPIGCPKCGNIMKRHFPETTSFKLKGEDWKKDGHALNKDEDIVRDD